MRKYLLAVGFALSSATAPILPAQQPAARPLLPQYAGAHREGTWELGLGAAAMVMDRQLTLDRVLPGVAARLGYNLDSRWSVSAGAALGSGTEIRRGTPAAFIQPFASLTWTPDVNATTNVFVIAGAGGTMVYNPRLTALFGAHLGFGVRQMVSERLALRLEAREQYESFRELAKPVFNGVVGAGLSFFIGGGPLRDSDGDGVPDRYDRCPGTPLGAVVDGRGCPMDSDHDGVPDGLDQCPDTPAGIRVDDRGCPVDSDGDGVPDYADRCPDTPPGVKVDPNGCPVDSDHDGVPDYLDRCAGTPVGAPVDSNGCPRDGDGDGVPDYLDHCPDTPPGVQVDAAGCPLDSDHDGVPDYRDRCPSTPPGTPVDANGCPTEPDADRDGVPDSRDQCPGTPPGVVVYRDGDYAGCAVHALPAAGASAPERAVAFRFVRGRPTLTPAARATLDTIAETMRVLPGARWELGAYTDAAGRVAVLRLRSQREADAVKAYLVRRGVPVTVLTAVGYGPEHPVASNRTAAGRRENNRLEIRRVQ